MRFLNHPSRTPIGLDVGSRQVNAVQLERSHGQFPWRVSAVACFPRAAPAIAAAAIDAHEVGNIIDVLGRRGFCGHRVVIPVPQEKLIGGVLDVPARTAAVPIAQIARMELARISRCAPDSFEMGYWDLPAGAKANRTAQVMAVGCAHRDANELMDNFEHQGLNVVGLDVRACALARAAAPILPGDAAVLPILDLGWESATVVMLLRGAIVYVRTLSDAGVRSLHEALRTKLALEADVVDYLLGEATPSTVDLPAEARALVAAHVAAMAHELGDSVSYVSQEYPEVPLARLLLTGAHAGIPGLAAHLSQALGLDVAKMTPAQVVECPAVLLESCTGPALSVAVGLAQFEAEFSGLEARGVA